jgi:hypothetical protein
VPPVSVDVIAILPEGWGLCNSCELLMARANLDQAPPDRGLDEYPPEWQADFQRLSALIYDLSERYGDRIRIRIFDPHSWQGLIKALRHGVRRYPTFVVDGRTKIVGWDESTLEGALATAGATPGSP